MYLDLWSMSKAPSADDGHHTVPEWHAHAIIAHLRNALGIRVRFSADHLKNPPDQTALRYSTQRGSCMATRARMCFQAPYL